MSYDDKDNIEDDFRRETQEGDERSPGINEGKETASQKRRGTTYKNGNRWFSLVALILVLSFVGGLGGAYVGNMIFNDQNTSLSPSQQSFTISPNDSLTTVSAVAGKNMSSVVGITTVETQQFWFSQQDVSGVGSGVVVHSDGYILTNSHVVADGEAKEITVRFEDGQHSEGLVLWNEPYLDLAVVKVERSGLPVASLGDSDQLVVGEVAVAIGNPLGMEFERTVTSGIISGLHRSIRIDANNIIEDLIQTDASINPGNSGGPLLNAEGEVIGINTAKIRSGEGLGFAIPINQVKPILQEIIETGTHQTVVLGIMGVSLEEYEARLGIDLAPEFGVVVIEVQSGSPADQAGILAGDIIVGMDKSEISNMGQLRRELYNYSKGEAPSVKIIRNGEETFVNPQF